MLLLTDAVDTWAASSPGEHAGKKLVNAMRADVKLLDDEDEKEEDGSSRQGASSPCSLQRRSCSKAKSKDVARVERASANRRRVARSFAGAAMPAHLEKLLARSGKEVPRGQRSLELNPTHPAVKALAALAAKNAEDPKLGAFITLLYEQSLVAEGSPLEDPNGFARRVTALLTQAIS